MSGLCVSDFDFELPPELIAQQPPAVRGQSRMLVVDRNSAALRDASFADFPEQLNPGDLLVLNDSRVIPARLFAQRTTRNAVSDEPQTLRAPSFPLFSAERVGEHEPTGAPGPAFGTWETRQPTGKIEVFLTESAGENLWRALVKPGKKVQVGDRLAFPSLTGSIELEAEVIERGEFGERLLRFDPVYDFYAVLDRIGHIPLPPYIRRDDVQTDQERYQTVYSHDRGSVAAPTAGLHFTPQILDTLAARGVEVARITLHVGLGTFAPLRVERVDEVHLHRERYTLSASTADALNRAVSEGRRIVAVGTTTVRTLEHCALQANGRPLETHSGETEIFISPGFQFRLVGALLTNFHLPQSSLLMLVSAFAGRERVLAAYAHAVREKYRFFSYGDCMFIV